MECLECGEPLREKWQKKFCSRSCAAKTNNKKYIKRKKPTSDNYWFKCRACGNRFQAMYQKDRKYCGLYCSREKAKEIKIANWLDGSFNGTRGKESPSLSHTIRNYLLGQTNYKCSRCGWGEKNIYTDTIPLEVHHIDGNCANNRPENLEVLCPNCHSLTEMRTSKTNKSARYKYRKEYLSSI